MIDFDRETGFATDAHCLLHAFDQLIAFAAHMRRVLATVFRRNLTQLDQLVSLGKESRRIDQRGRDAERAGFHFAPHQLAHLIELRRSRRFVFEADDVFANRGCADKRRKVLRDTSLFQIFQIFSQRGPFDVILHVALLFANPLLHLII